MKMSKKCTIFSIAVALLVTNFNAQAVNKFDSKKDELVFNIVNLSNDLFLSNAEKKGMFYAPIDYNRWNNLLSQINTFVNKNAKDLLNREDKDITGTFDVVLKSNNEIMRTIHAMYTNYVAQPVSAEKLRAGVSVIYALNGVRKNLEMQRDKPSLLKLKMEKTTLARKKETIEIIMHLAQVLEKICTKAIVDYNRLAENKE